MEANSRGAAELQAQLRAQREHRMLEHEARLERHQMERQQLSDMNHLHTCLDRERRAEQQRRQQVQSDMIREQLMEQRQRAQEEQREEAAFAQRWQQGWANGVRQDVAQDAARRAQAMEVQRVLLAQMAEKGERDLVEDLQVMDARERAYNSQLLRHVAMPR
mmetsp:Transcript_66583/g.168764  ORF Transcript_66583/g.168764 Transcript_66583/m.168764 type:complete len:162 (+) Transcript_66583:1-486(+)